MIPSDASQPKRATDRVTGKFQTGLFVLIVVGMTNWGCSSAKRTPTLPPPEFEPPDLQALGISSVVPSASAAPTAPSNVEPSPQPSSEPSAGDAEPAPATSATDVTLEGTRPAPPDSSNRIEDPK